MIPNPVQRWTAALLALAFSLACSAQTDRDEEVAAADPPGRVGRVSLLAGSATLTDMDSGQRQPAYVNWPVGGGQYIATDAGGRAEIRIGSLALRLDGGSVVDFVRIDDETIELVVQRGAVALHVRNRDTLGEIDLTTSRERVVLDDIGRYRLDVDPVPGLTSLTVVTGTARILTGESSFQASGGQRVDVSGDPVAIFQVVSPLADAFDDWVAPLDRRDDALRSAGYVSAETTGVESLDDYGQWRTVPEYGQIWFPSSVVAGWVPYRFGRWIWVAPWGWTWLDEAQWGFAPFHYGRWVLLNGRWGWVPGRYVARPLYAPCLVGWYGGAGPVGWFPLAPGDIYVPAYHASRPYVEAINVQHVGGGSQGGQGGPQPRYAYQHNPGAATWVDRETLVQHRSVGRALQAPPSHWHAAPATPMSPVAGPARSARPDGERVAAREPLRHPPSPVPAVNGGEPGRREHPVARPLQRAARAEPVQPAAEPAAATRTEASRAPR